MKVTKFCPICKEELPYKAVRCPFCGSALSQDSWRPEATSVEKTSFQKVQASGNSNRKLVVWVAAGLVLLCVFLIVVFTSGADYDKRADRFIRRAGLTYSDVLVQSHTINPGVYFINQDGRLAKYDLKEKKETSLNIVHCVGGEDIEFPYPVDVSKYGDKLFISGDNGWNGAGAGYNVVCLNTLNDIAHYVCFGRVVKVDPPYVVSYSNVSADGRKNYSYYSMASGQSKEVTPCRYSGKIGKYPIVMELAFDISTKHVVGTYYYRSQGANNRMILSGVSKTDGIITLEGYENLKNDAPVNEYMTLGISGDYISGTWKNSSGSRSLKMHLTKIK